MAASRQKTCVSSLREECVLKWCTVSECSRSVQNNGSFEIRPVAPEEEQVCWYMIDCARMGVTSD